MRTIYTRGERNAMIIGFTILIFFCIIFVVAAPAPIISPVPLLTQERQP